MLMSTLCVYVCSHYVEDANANLWLFLAYYHFASQKRFTPGGNVPLYSAIKVEFIWQFNSSPCRPTKLTDIGQVLLNKVQYF